MKYETPKMKISMFGSNIKTTNVNGGQYPDYLTGLSDPTGQQTAVERAIKNAQVTSERIFVFKKQ